MYEKKTIYCELKFLENWFESKPIYQDFSPNNILKVKNWFSVYQMLYKASVIFDITDNEYYKLKKSNSHIKNIIHRLNKPGKGIYSYKEYPFPNFDNDNYIPSPEHQNSICLTTYDETKCMELSKRYGILVLNLNMLLNDAHFFNDSGIPLPIIELNNDKNDLAIILNSDMHVNRSWCNSILLVDNYLVSCVERCWECNIKPVLLKLLDGNPVEKIHISVFSQIRISEYIDKEGKKHESKSYDGQCSTLLQNIKNLCSELSMTDVVVTVYNSTNMDFHDRVIVTNNLWISCGKGFTVPLIGKKANDRPSALTILFPFVQTSTNWCDGAYINLMKKVIEVFDRSNTKYKDYWGDDGKANPLIQYYKKELHL